MGNNSTKEKSSNTDFLQKSKFRLAIGILFFYLIFIVFLTFYIEVDEKYWSRFLFLFSGVEAIVFAAIGYVFGRDVSRSIEKNAEENAEKSKQEKEKALKDKQNAEKQASKDREHLIRIQEAVLSENEIAKNSNMGTFGFDKAETGSSINAMSTNSRSLKLAKESLNVFESGKIISFEYEIEVDDFNSINIDGNTQYEKKGRFASVFVYGNIVEVEVDRDNFKPWKFTATNIRDNDYNEMKMSNTPLESQGNKSFFRIEYK
ncbi:hypothetical protein [Tenacibaculum sp. M341]|uniref:hypothetical protein n=1 Tax=Tenacibaculum sp. M341 TaxID=2530339 RepID=UPI00104505EB|nr:hypothetical protein [Tenacibaculum sp. M341]TCI90728.1 hypothetical protein EYW44_13485 [Tenacibaculum sp. M341]